MHSATEKKAMGHYVRFNHAVQLCSMKIKANVFEKMEMLLDDIWPVMVVPVCK